MMKTPLKFLSILLVALILRLYKFNVLTSFGNDQGIDLLIARRLVIEGVWPAVGPYLSVDKFFVPPTYYYILSFFLWLGKTPEGTALFFVVLDLVAFILLYFLARGLFGTAVALVVGFLYAISVVAIAHARSMWQPHPVQVFLFGSLFMLYLAWEKKRFIYLICSLLLFTLAVSIYPSPLLLVPFYFVHTVDFFRKIMHASLWLAYLKSVFAIGLIFSIVYFPLGVFEMSHGYPTYYAIRSASFGMSTILEMIQDLGMNLFGLFLAFSALRILHPYNYVLFVPVFLLFFFAALCLPMTDRGDHTSWYRRVISFLRLPWLSTGFVAVLVFRDMFHLGWPWHRLYGFILFFFLLFGVMIRHAMKVRSLFYRGTAFLLVAFYALGNGLSVYASLAFNTETGEVDNAREVVRYIGSEATRRSVRRSDFTVVAYAPSGDWISYITPELYFLWEWYEYPVTFDAYGNNLEFNINKPPHPYVFLVCKEFNRIENIYKNCLGSFFERFPDYTIIKQKLFPQNTVVFALQRG